VARCILAKGPLEETFMCEVKKRRLSLRSCLASFLDAQGDGEIVMLQCRGCGLGATHLMRFPRIEREVRKANLSDTTPHVKDTVICMKRGELINGMTTVGDCIRNYSEAGAKPFNHQDSPCLKCTWGRRRREAWSRDEIRGTVPD
jgi:ribosomal protein L37E